MFFEVAQNNGVSESLIAAPSSPLAIPLLFEVSPLGFALSTNLQKKMNRKNKYETMFSNLTFKIYLTQITQTMVTILKIIFIFLFYPTLSIWNIYFSGICSTAACQFIVKFYVFYWFQVIKQLYLNWTIWTCLSRFLLVFIIGGHRGWRGYPLSKRSVDQIPHSRL